MCDACSWPSVQWYREKEKSDWQVRAGSDAGPYLERTGSVLRSRPRVKSDLFWSSLLRLCDKTRALSGRQLFSVRTVKSKRLYKTRKPRTDCAALWPGVLLLCDTADVSSPPPQRPGACSSWGLSAHTSAHPHCRACLTLQLGSSLAVREGMFKDLNTVSIRELSTFLDASQCGRWRCFMDGVRSLEPTQTDGWLMSMVDYQASAGQLSFIVLLLFCFKLWANINLVLLRWGHVAEGCRDQLQG